jgi:hypothetical protein
MQPNSYLAIGTLLAVVCSYAGYRLYRRYRGEQQKARQTINTFMRMFPALVEHEQFFKLLGLQGQRSHYLARHGPMLRLHEIKDRALTGRLEVSGLAGAAVSSARWFRHDHLLLAIESAIELWGSGERPNNGVFKFQFSEVIGEGFPKGFSIPVETKIAKVIIRKGVVVTAFPVLPDPHLPGQSVSDLMFWPNNIAKPISVLDNLSTGQDSLGKLESALENYQKSKSPKASRDSGEA